MVSHASIPDETFVPAPAGTRVRVTTMLVLGIFLACMAGDALWLPRSPAGAYWAGVLAPLAGVPVVAVVWAISRIRAYELSAGELVVRRALLPVRFSLEGFVSAEPDRDPLAGARKITGNDGLGAVSGSFRSERFGRFRAFLSDREHAVVLRAAAGTFVVSPAQTAVFIDAVTRRARALAGASARSLA